MVIEKTRIGKASEIAKGEARPYRLANGDEIVVFNDDGKFYALDNACPHMGGPLCEGSIEGHFVTCPWHGWEFDIRSGLCTNETDQRTKSYKILVEKDDLYLTE